MLLAFGHLQEFLDVLGEEGAKFNLFCFQDHRISPEAGKVAIDGAKGRGCLNVMALFPDLERDHCIARLS
jgi:hypothetical protein